MRYLVRSIKYFISYMVFLAVILLLLILFGAADWDFSTLFRDGSESLWKIAVIFAAFAAVYPKIGFTSRTVIVQHGEDKVRDTVLTYMKQLDYILEKGDGDVMSFRKGSLSARLSRMYEDRITVTLSEGKIAVDGLRKDVMRICGGLEFRINTEDRQ